ncbi:MULTISPECIES: hypothetical protein [unclassified Paenibacillus]|uniref:hypothetical protein n=1 Tax=unclassified Paenibacillus TaxID=185978 RepID=UPI002406C839|nr:MULTISPECIES: hypothetical protein [unclassified Paenibacillus]MDF9841298.1 ABC-type enterochelin transport system ATPase subunit [Paenibacillus sp. PastF-2]MDF9847889.1 ABC-type enterochelin transport system ATPase subunit [Paenibacillus sp. PastM-2]MDF9854457.1 ABC-type enterochelin transport system ATPase subunit [Paenibacillus sp. PastF-1]MDH6479934.1 ABC-type enterochelin transport system ATPase subunit [Paenibacillus sp. PastH-2]MDH6507164.1 ABC-type enterochelin transport system ATPa
MKRVRLEDTMNIIELPVEVMYEGQQYYIYPSMIVSDNGTELLVANPQYCLDLPQAEKFLELLKNLAAKHYYCYDGGTLHI